MALLPPHLWHIYMPSILEQMKTQSVLTPFAENSLYKYVMHRRDEFPSIYINAPESKEGKDMNHIINKYLNIISPKRNPLTMVTAKQKAMYATKMMTDIYLIMRQLTPNAENLSLGEFAARWFTGSRAYNHLLENIQPFTGPKQQEMFLTRFVDQVIADLRNNNDLADLDNWDQALDLLEDLEAFAADDIDPMGFEILAQIWQIKKALTPYEPHFGLHPADGKDWEKFVASDLYDKAGVLGYGEFEVDGEKSMYFYGFQTMQDLFDAGGTVARTELKSKSNLNFDEPSKGFSSDQRHAIEMFADYFPQHVLDCGWFFDAKKAKNPCLDIDASLLCGWMFDWQKPSIDPSEYKTVSLLDIELPPIKCLSDIVGSSVSCTLEEALRTDPSRCAIFSSVTPDLIFELTIETKCGVTVSCPITAEQFRAYNEDSDAWLTKMLNIKPTKLEVGHFCAGEMDYVREGISWNAVTFPDFARYPKPMKNFSQQTLNSDMATCCLSAEEAERQRSDPNWPQELFTEMYEGFVADHARQIIDAMISDKTCTTILSDKTYQFLDSKGNWLEGIRPHVTITDEVKSIKVGLGKEGGGGDLYELRQELIDSINETLQKTMAADIDADDAEVWVTKSVIKSKILGNITVKDYHDTQDDALGFARSITQNGYDLEQQEVVEIDVTPASEKYAGFCMTFIEPVETGQVGISDKSKSAALDKETEFFLKKGDSTVRALVDTGGDEPKDYLRSFETREQADNFAHGIIDNGWMVGEYINGPDNNVGEDYCRVCSVHVRYGDAPDTFEITGKIEVYFGGIDDGWHKVKTFISGGEDKVFTDLFRIDAAAMDHVEHILECGYIDVEDDVDTFYPKHTVQKIELHTPGDESALYNEWVFDFETFDANGVPTITARKV